MSNSGSKQERRRARVWSIRKDSGRLEPRLTTPTHAGAFLMRRKELLAGNPFFPAPKGRIMSAVPRTDVETALHRLSNYVECQLSDIIRQLLVESRANAVATICWSGSRFIENLREIRDGKEAGDE
jgi:hypothetical protein